MTKRQTHITISEDTRERLLQYADENHISGGLSGVIDFLAWHKVKVDNSQFRGQTSLNLEKRCNAATGNILSGMDGK